MTPVDAIVNALLYEGYMLYPYRPTSVKNRQRWTLGGLCPRAWSAIHHEEPNAMHVECLLEGSPTTGVDVDVGFLQLVDRRVRADGGRVVESGLLEVDGQRYRAWQEATERRFAVPRVRVARLLRAAVRLPFAFDGATSTEVLRNAAREPIGAYERVTQPIEGRVRLACEPVASDAYRLIVDVANTTALAEAPAGRNAAMAAALVACHLVLHLDGGDFVSLVDPPERLQQAGRACLNDGAWPVLVGEQQQRHTMLASPIILYDYPQIAAQSAGELFDGTEIDEILSLRILALTDAEKGEMAAADSRARALLERTEQLTLDQMSAMHGVMRRIDTGRQEQLDGPRLSYWRGNGIELRVGDQVRLRPRRNADIFDLELSGKLATIQAIERDFDDRLHVAVTVDDDPGRDLGIERMVGHRFYFAPDEVERIEQRQ